MKIWMRRFVAILPFIIVSGAAHGNVGAAINKQTGTFSYVMGTQSRKTLITAALKTCRSTAKNPIKDCAPAKNDLGACLDPVGTKREWGAFAGHNEKDGWKGYLACAPSVKAAHYILGAVCKGCALGESFRDESADPSVE